MGWQNDWRWCKRTFGAGDIYELDPLLVEEATCTRTVFSTLVDELAHQGHLFVRHNKGLRCKVCNVYKGYRQFRFWSRHPCMPRPKAAAVISQFKNKKRQQSDERNKTSSKHDEKELYHCTSLGYRDIQSTHSHPEHFPLPVSLEPELDLAHTHQCCGYSLSQTAEQSGESHHVLTKLHGYDMEGKKRRIASFADTGGPRAPLRSNFDDPEGWDTSVSEEGCSQRDVVHRMVPVAGRPIIMCGISGCSGSIRLGTKCWVNSLGVKWKQHCRPLWAPVRPASQCRLLLVSLLQVNTPLSLVGLLAHFPLCIAYRALIVWKLIGFGGVESVTRDTYISMPCKLVFFSSGLAVTSEHAVEAVIPGFSAESSAPVQGKSCVDRAVSHGFDVAMSGGSCGKDTSPAHLARSQNDVGTQYAHVGYPGVELVSRATYISRKKRNLETVQRHSKALKKAQRMRNANSLHNLRSAGTIHVTVRCRQRWWSFEATEVSVRRIWRIPSESETQA